MQPSPWTLERHERVGSTMDVARERARAGAPDGTVIVAEEMTGGRGSHGRPWVAPKGGVYLSIVLRGLKDPHLLTLALGNAVADTLEVAGVEPGLKWVNDVHVAGHDGGLGRKIAGILVEAESTGGAFDFLVAGIGVNVNGKASDLKGLEKAATTIEDQLGCDSCIPDLEALLLDGVGRWLGRVREGQDAEIVAAFRARDVLAGKTVRVADGKTVVEGIAAGVDDRGHLLVKSKTGVQALSTGTVQVLG
ncbi:MAG TPA: biotin--[acetyl-CoA-carboxylase] ligase [Candidatus Thermoplasmatota archaeon]|nr:biotin--[acetyl-CoA-carboxylase] ligase [Candidatus Thermoplasmatota archaeon]